MRNQTGGATPRGLTRRQRVVKRLFDLGLAVPGFIATLPIVVVSVLVATIDTREWGVFSQERIGRGGETFNVHKIRSMRTSKAHTTTVTRTSDPRITKFGAFMRRTKIDELAQLWDVVIGRMSIVGPRPDVAGWADELVGNDRIVLSVRPGITGPASIAFRDEESILESVQDPETYNRETLWPQKVRMNVEYVQNWSVWKDISYVKDTFR